MRLITIPISHYCEKARWALARLGLQYHEERHLQGFHYSRAFWLSRGPMVPVLVDGERVVSDSSRILEYLDRYAPAGSGLYPDDPLQRAQVKEWETLFDEQLGVDSRRWMYYHFLPHRKAALTLSSQGVPFYEKIFAPLLYPLLAAFLRRRLAIDRAEAAAALDRSRKLYNKIDALLADGRKYLVGERFSAADLTLASLSAPFLLPTVYGVHLPSIDEVPPGMRDVVREFRDTATGRYVLGLYAAR